VGPDRLAERTPQFSVAIHDWFRYNRMVSIATMLWTPVDESKVDLNVNSRCGKCDEPFLYFSFC
jgi:hypothetical protein